MEINDLVALAEQLNIDSIFFSSAELKDTDLSSREYQAKQHLSISWGIKRPNCITVRAWNTSDEGYIDERILQISLTYDYRLLIERNLLKRALMIKYKFDDYDALDFDYEDFNYPLSVELLCRTIKDDFPELTLDNNDNSINILNQLMRTPNFYQHASRFNPSLLSSKKISDLVEKISAFSGNDYETIPEDSQRLLRRLNKYILEKFYPHKIPKKKPFDDMDSHQNICIVDTFLKEHVLKSPVADVTWIGQAANIIKMAIKNKSKRSIPFSSSDVFLVVNGDNLLKCSPVFDGVPTGWFTNSSIDIIKGLNVKATFHCDGLNSDSVINRFICKQNYYYNSNGWYSCYSIFDFQLNGAKTE